MNPRQRTRFVALVVAALVLLAGCGGSSDDTDDTAAPASDPSSETADETPSEPDADAEDVAAGDADADEPAPESDDPPATSTTLAETVPVLPVIEVSPTDAGPRPLLAWAAVPGASRYSVVVLGADGGPYWGWSGEDTAVTVGALDDPDLAGPWVHEPMTWTVAALDADGTPIALSSASPLVP